MKTKKKQEKEKECLKFKSSFCRLYINKLNEKQKRNRKKNKNIYT